MLFHYLSPRIFPFFPRQTGVSGLLIDAQLAFDLRCPHKFSGTIELSVHCYSEGKIIDKNYRMIVVDHGIVSSEPIWLDFDYDCYGYAEISLQFSKPAFVNILPEPGYGTLNLKNGDCITLNPDMKYANPRVITQMKRFDKYCASHTLVYSDRNNKSGNSILLINPYGQSILSRFLVSKKPVWKGRIEKSSAVIIDLDNLVSAGEPETVMITANNRIVSYDLRHIFGDQHTINSIDHHDQYSGVSTHESLSAFQFLKRTVSDLIKSSVIR